MPASRSLAYQAMMPGNFIDELRGLIADRALRTFFQPLIALRDGTIMGFEALNRGPAESVFANARELFGAAHAAGLLSSLDRACWASSLNKAAVLFEGRRGFTNLFVNVMPEEIRQPTFLDHVLQVARDTKTLPNQIVVEVTEGSRIDDYQLFREILSGYRAAGLRIAVDDAGAGHSGLQTIVELNPDFVKVDRALVSGIDSHAGKRAAVEALTLIARRLGLGLVAEGVETIDELMELRRLGVPYAQGFLLGPPTEAPLDAPPEIRVLLQPGNPVPVERQRRSAGLFLGDIVTPTPTVPSQSRVEEVFMRFERERTDGFVVLDSGIPLGVVMRAALYQLLSQRYGHELYLSKPIKEIAAHPLIIDARVPIEDVSRVVTNRPEESFHDSIVVTRDREYLGTVSVQRLLEAITNLRLASARMENPLTGLPGNPAIEDELTKRLDAGLPFSMLYADLDHFKAFNDHFGFHHGDRAIKIAADVLVRVISECNGFVGHIGGDDFFAVVPPGEEVEIATTIQTEFERSTWQLYDESERVIGRYEGLDRYGQPAIYDLLSITVATLPVQSNPGKSPAELLDALSVAKLEAKASRRAGMAEES